ncbi:hypothetical protein [Umezawaea sp. Da 62-37]|uniref:hypothetical protein n=1 Tax=Umezawaea sp. Da 62-37 TaxID=3075927 RepID=UPI0028F6ECB2|nr:hypothetical protein [Umezawaea sp. Da 62-37]WNV87199.1 hypothetical protein RM788_02575 [Umezawaea sp. Da 62-37]
MVIGVNVDIHVKKSHQVTLVTLAITFLGTAIGFLTLANDTSSWPFGGPGWITGIVGIGLALGGAILVMRQPKRPLLVLAGIVVIALGSIIGTTAIGGGGTPATSVVGPMSLGRGKLSLVTPVEGQIVGNPVRVSGKIDEALRGGGSIWFFIANLPITGGPLSGFYLKDGPCSLGEDGRSWDCGDRSLAEIGQRQVGIYIVYARGEVASELVSKLTQGAKFDQMNVCNAKNGNKVPNPCVDDDGQSDGDPRNFAKIPEGKDSEIMTSAKIGVRR